LVVGENALVYQVGKIKAIEMKGIDEFLFYKVRLMYLPISHLKFLLNILYLRKQIMLTVAGFSFVESELEKI